MPNYLDLFGSPVMPTGQLDSFISAIAGAIKTPSTTESDFELSDYERFTILVRPKLRGDILAKLHKYELLQVPVHTLFQLVAPIVTTRPRGNIIVTWSNPSIYGAYVDYCHHKLSSQGYLPKYSEVQYVISLRQFTKDSTVILVITRVGATKLPASQLDATMNYYPVNKESIHKEMNKLAGITQIQMESKPESKSE